MGYQIDEDNLSLQLVRSSAEMAGCIEERLRSVAAAHGRGGTALAASAIATQAMLLRQSLTALAAGETAIGVPGGPETLPSWYVRDDSGLPVVAD